MNHHYKIYLEKRPNFRDICQANDKQASQKARETVSQFVKEAGRQPRILI